MPHIRHDVTFTGSAQDYAPIWRVNMIWLVLSAGLSLPWALARSLRYFYRHTHVAGAHFDYHVNPWKMFAGNMVGTLVLNAIYYGISLTGPYKTMGVAAMQLLTAAMLPLGLHGFIEFQLMHTSWRGHRMRLDATVGDAFKSMGGPTMLYIVGGVLTVWSVVSWLDGARSQAYGLCAAGLVVLSVALPWLYVQYRHHMHRHAVLGPWRSGLEAPAWGHGALHISWRATALAIGVLFLVVVPACWGLSTWLGADAALVARLKQSGHSADAIRLALVVIPGFMLFFVLMMALPFSYLGAKLQNRLLPQSSQAQLRFESRLSDRELLSLSVRNWALVVCTLGWYYPKAAIQDARLRVQSVSVWIPAEALAELAHASSEDAALPQAALSSTLASPQ